MNHATRPSKVAYSVRVLAALGMLTALSVVLTWLFTSPFFLVRRFSNMILLTYLF